MEFTGKTVLLTGSTGGIGHAIARRLRRAGATLTLTGRRAEVLAPLARELDATALTVDLGDPAAVAQLIADAGDVDVVVANAALPAAGLLTSFSTEDIDQALQVNLRAPIVMARHYAEAFRAKRAGHLLFISSISGKVGTPHSSMYSATKFRPGAARRTRHRRRRRLRGLSRLRARCRDVRRLRHRAAQGRRHQQPGERR